MHTATHSSSPPFADRRDGVVVSPTRVPAWGAVVAGAVAGLATQILLMMAFTGIGLGIAQPATVDNPAATFGIGTALAWTLGALISLFVGGWVAGRCAAKTHRDSGTLHGFLVWCVGTIAAVLLIATGTGALLGGAASVVGQGLSAAGKPLAGAADLAKDAVAQNASALTGMVNEVTENPQVRNAAGTAAARREVGQALQQLFKAEGNLRDPQARTAVMEALTRAGVSQSDATRMVDSWTQSMEQARTQLAEAKQAAAAKAREVADATAAAVGKAARWAFIGFVLGALAAMFGGRRGAAGVTPNSGETVGDDTRELSGVRHDTGVVTAVPVPERS